MYIYEGWRNFRATYLKLSICMSEGDCACLLVLHSCVLGLFVFVCVCVYVLFCSLCVFV